MTSQINEEWKDAKIEGQTVYSLDDIIAVAKKAEDSENPEIQISVVDGVLYAIDINKTITF